MNDFSLDRPSPVRRAKTFAADRRHAAVHEAGHVVVARYLGLSIVHAEIRKIEPQDYSEKQWVGSTQCLMLGADPSTCIMVAVAGAVAEACWGNEIFDELYITLQESPEKMSQADWEMSGCSPGEVSEQFWDAMEQVFELLNRETGKLWNTLLTEARGLIEKSRPEPSMDPEPIGLVR
ncbi:hypothetical protein [Bradyrhizobium sp. WSM471]|uniref:hypothetical protein n=1 Tax=Bradyrhizobium sp. WSM471 TaxID=319017 RepID=UPI00056D299C|nr:MULTISPECIES: hypothetical protein [Bradyrhizobium]UFW42307.1 hypothetical protein BcanWSM471_03605 [Bradyrhizobium canariense]